MKNLHIDTDTPVLPADDDEGVKDPLYGNNVLYTYLLILSVCEGNDSSVDMFWATASTHTCCNNNMKED